jgi:carbamoyl-phosphate synthase large subunit
LEDISDDELQRKLARPNSHRFSYITYALQHGWSIDEIYRLSRIDRWFLDQLQQVMDIQKDIEGSKLEDIDGEELRAFKEVALSDRRLAYITERSEDEVREYRKKLKIVPVYKRVDTCGAEFESHLTCIQPTRLKTNLSQRTGEK